MVAKNGEETARATRIKIERLKVKKETVRDLDANEQKGVKGASGTVCRLTLGCPSGGQYSLAGTC
jgi:hypothetical protein